ncbi:Uncharacterized protein dnm_056890 [Desulfonema magnum]|uniref:Uncharacterized protein n=1 Tax=Desulfonema magnum TaxID=45655 RepID=A0A975BQ87_9BACT|nr:Uncharacterized protein dnm_056890 [Desulfonema magnum]
MTKGDQYIPMPNNALRRCLSEKLYATYCISDAMSTIR